MKNNRRLQDDYSINYRWFLILTFLSGFPVLIYEIVWARMLVNFLGGSIYSITITAATFMLGLALGAYFLGHYADRVRRYLRLYAFIELAVGLSALSVPALIGILKAIRFGVSPLEYSYYRLFIFQRMSVVFLILLVPTFFIGGTLPVLSTFIRRNPAASGRMLGYLYGFNTAGSIIGCLSAVLIVIQSFGLTLSLGIASAMNIFVGCACLILDYRSRRVPPARSSEQVERPLLSFFNPRDLLRDLSIGQKILLVAFGLSGFTALAYEMLWTRMLIFWLKSTTFSFGIILAIFLGSIALGSLASSLLIDRLSERHLGDMFAYIELFVGIAALSALYLYNLGVRNFTVFAPPVYSGLLITFLTFFLIAFPFGMLFPLALKLLLPRERKAVSGYVGLGYMANTLGAMTGVLIAGLVLIPALGVQKSIYLVSSVNIMIFCIVFLTAGKPGITKPVIILSVISGLFIFQMLIPKDYLRRSLASKVKSDIVFLKEGADATVIVSRERDDFYFLWINGLVTAAPGAQMRYRAHIPLLLSPGPRDVLVIGFGSGVTAGIAAELYGTRTDCVEISSGVIEAGKLFSRWNYNVLDSDNINIFIMDARNFVELTGKKYDVIIADVSSPYLTNLNSLFSKEFYAACYRILKDGGIMLQWIPSSMATKSNSRILMKTFISVFDNSYLFFKDNMVGAKKPLKIDLTHINERISGNRVLMRELRSSGINNAGDLAALLVAGESQLADLTSGLPVITDDNPFIEFGVSRDILSGDYRPADLYPPGPINTYSPEDIAEMKSGLGIK